MSNHSPRSTAPGRMWNYLAVTLVVVQLTCLRANQDFDTCMVKLQKCEAVTAKFPISCKAWREAGYNVSDLYIIDPDGPGGLPQFEVECVMGDWKGDIVTQVHHDKDESMRSTGKRYGPLQNVHNINYKAPTEQIVNLMRVTQHCSQYIKYTSDGVPMDFRNRRTAWYMRNGTAVYSWGGAPTGSGRCLCGLTNGCAASGYRCNSDTRHHSRWMTDEGPLEDQDALPVTKLAFGYKTNGGNYEEAQFRLGPLRCYN